MADVDINKFRASVVRDGSKPASPGFVVSEGQDPVDPSGSGQNHLPVTIAAAATGLAITDSQVLGGAGTTSQYLRGDASLATFPALTGYVPYTGANQTVNLNTQQLQAGHTTLTTNGSTETLTINHTSGSGKAINVTKGGNGEGLYINKTSGSGNAATIVGTLEATTLKKTGGTSSQFLKADGSVDSTAYGTGTVTSVGLSSATSGVTIGSTPVTTSGTITLAIATASGSQNGLLSSTDWTTFNNKTSNVGTVTSVAAITLGTSGTDLSSSVANSTTTPVITLNVPTASAANRGALSAADWTTFNSKQNALTNPVTGTGTTNYLPKFTGSTTIGNSLVFDNGTNVGIGTIIPQRILTIYDTNSATLYQTPTSGTTANSGFYVGQTGNVSYLYNYNNFPIVLATNSVESVRLFETSQNVHIGPTPLSDNGARLQVSGPATFSSSVTATGFSVNNSGFRGGIYPYLSVVGSGSDNSLTLFSEGGANQGNIYFCPNGSATKVMTINTSGNVLIGTATDASGKLQVLGADNAIISQIKSASGMLQIYPYFSAYGGPIIQALDGGASSYVPLRIEASSTTFSSTVATTGIKFPASQVASADANTLDDYEEGTWSPNVDPQTGTYVMVFGSKGTYTKIGRVVTVQYYFRVVNKGTGSGSCILSNLPFASLTTSTDDSYTGTGIRQGNYLNTLVINQNSSSINITENTGDPIVQGQWNAGSITYFT